MRTSLPPLLNRQFACIYSRETPALGAVVSAYFNSPKVYFPVFSFPDVKHPNSEEEDEQSDAWFSHYLGKNAAVFINNAIARQRPQKIFLAGLSEMQKSYIRPYIPGSMSVEVDAIGEVHKVMEFLGRKFDGSIACRSTELLHGLGISKYLNKQLNIDEAAEILGSRLFSGRNCLVVVEDDGSESEIAAANYAFSIQADLLIVPSFTRAELYPIQKLIHAWKAEHSLDAYKQLNRMLTDRVSGVDFTNYQFATFFTKGFPYGLLLENRISFTHVLANISCDHFVFNIIASERIPSSFGSAVVFSPGVMSDEETDDVVQSLDRNNYLVAPLLGREATVKALSNYGGYYPFDVLHICSHGGETDGYHVVQDFLDRTGKAHQVEYDEIVGFSPTSPGKGLLSRKAIFRKFDGLLWMSPELDKQDIPTYVFDDMKNALSLKDEPNGSEKRVEVRDPIYGSCHIQCHDSIHQGDFQSLAGSSSPFIFNNTCSSWHEIATTFVAAGARGYIGTVWDVNNSSATTAANAFYREVLSRGYLLDAFREMGETVRQTEDRDIYIFWGLHFSTLKSPSRKSARKILEHLSGSFQSILRKFHASKSPKIQQRYAPVLDFLYAKLMEGATGQQLAQLRQLGPGLRRSIRSVPVSVGRSGRRVVDL